MCPFSLLSARHGNCSDSNQSGAEKHVLSSSASWHTQIATNKMTLEFNRATPYRIYAQIQPCHHRRNRTCFLWISLLMALGCPNHSVAVHHYQHSASTAHRCCEMRRAAMFNHSIPWKLYQREKDTHIPVAMLVQDIQVATQISAEHIEDIWSIEYESQNPENHITQSSSYYDFT